MKSMCRLLGVVTLVSLSWPQQAKALCGDVNNSGSATTADIVLLVNHVFRGEPAPENPWIADFNREGTSEPILSAADVIALVKHVLRAEPIDCGTDTFYFSLCAAGNNCVGNVPEPVRPAEHVYQPTATATPTVIKSFSIEATPRNELTKAPLLPVRISSPAKYNAPWALDFPKGTQMQMKSTEIVFTAHDRIPEGETRSMIIETPFTSWVNPSDLFFGGSAYLNVTEAYNELEVLDLDYSPYPGALRAVIEQDWLANGSTDQCQTDSFGNTQCGFGAAIVRVKQDSHIAPDASTRLVYYTAGHINGFVPAQGELLLKIEDVATGRLVCTEQYTPSSETMNLNTVLVRDEHAWPAPSCFNAP